MAMIVSLFKMQVQASSINQAFTLSIDLKPYILILVLLTLTSCITHLSLSSGIQKKYKI
jgi:hypothetical protein